MSVGHIAYAHLEVALFQPLPVGHVTSIRANYDQVQSLCRGLLRCGTEMSLHDLRAGITFNCGRCRRPAPR